MLLSSQGVARCHRFKPAVVYWVASSLLFLHDL
jgi:hypothetical protein